MKIVVLDTNIWLSESALMTPVGCAFSHYIAKGNLKIGLPEVIEKEVKYKFRENIRKYRLNIKKDYDRMLAMFGRMKEIVMPSDEDIEKKVLEIFDFHKDRIIRIAFDLHSAKSSFEKIIKKEPPNLNNDQQFKDGVIWGNCLELAKNNDVLLVTKDKGFFADRKYEKGLDNN